MKKSIFILVSLFASVTLAQEYPTIDIINDSNIPITVIYDECQSERVGVEITPPSNCIENTAILHEKSSGNNFISYANRKEKDQNPNVLIIKKIVSSLGEQNFISFSSFNEINQLYEDDKKSFKLCYAFMVPPYSSFNNLVVLDNHGTSKFYCHRY
ncbi:MAG: hypothetical protein A3F46_03690 [Legionellales bacterium RIFCSPHIGHO2_12_FULL_42_9]|nr:MAG: hypothetical protein A3F46_03690 [Legionellales bacterium RIFCSPHIGHO2_12_FULL_42_9]